MANQILETEHIEIFAVKNNYNKQTNWKADFIFLIYLAFYSSVNT